MSDMPLISIIVPNYNHRLYLPARLESIRSQSFHDFELILLDDASTDRSAEYLQQFADEPRTLVVVNEQNSGGPFGQWNKGVERARGKYIWIAESDDVALPPFLETLVAILEDNPDVGLAETDSHRIDETGTVLGLLSRCDEPALTSHWQQSFFADGLVEIQQTLYVQNTIPSASAVLFRRELYLEAGPAPDELKLCGDWWQWVKLLSRSQRYFHATPLSQSRIHAASQRARSVSDGRYEIEALEIQSRIGKLTNLDSTVRKRGARRYAAVRLHSVRSGQFSGSFGAHLKLLRKLCAADFSSGIRFLLRLPYAQAIGCLKRFLGRAKA